MPELADQVPKKLEQADAEWADVVVTMGCGDACPVLPGKRYVDWNLPDPVVMPLEEVRALRDDIERRPHAKRLGSVEDLRSFRLEQPDDAVRLGVTAQRSVGAE